MVSVRKFVSFLGVFISLFNQANIEAYFTKIEQLQSGESTVYLLSDRHNGPRADLHDKHQAEILNVLKQKSGSLIVEDGSIFIRYVQTEEGITNKYTVLSDEIIETWKKNFKLHSPLFFLHSTAFKQGIKSINVEFRFPEKQSLKHLFAIKASRLNKIENELSGSDLYDAFVVLRNEITKLENACAPILDALKSSSKTIEEFVKTENYSLTNEMIQVLGSEVEPTDTKEDIFNCIVHYIFVLTVDAEVISSLHNLRDEKNIFICLGSKHIENISNALQNSPFHSVAMQTGAADDKKIEVLDLSQVFNETTKPVEIKRVPGIFSQLQNLISAAMRAILQLFVV